MTTRTQTLTEFLLARIAEDEAAALEQPEWARATPGGPMACVGEDSRLETTFGRVLAECEAKRRIVAWCSERDRVYIGTFATDIPREKDFVPGPLVHQTDAIMLRFLAMPYADHSEFQEEWKP